MPLVLAAPAKVPSLPANVTLMPPGGVWFGPVSSGAHMTDEREAFERLERRLEQLEAIVRKVLSRGDLPLRTLVRQPRPWHRRGDESRGPPHVRKSRPLRPSSLTPTGAAPETSSNGSASGDCWSWVSWRSSRRAASS